MLIQFLIFLRDPKRAHRKFALLGDGEAAAHVLALVPLHFARRSASAQVRVGTVVVHILQIDTVGEAQAKAAVQPAVELLEQVNL